MTQEKGHWVTAKGKHIFIPDSAMNKAVNKKSYANATRRSSSTSVGKREFINKNAENFKPYRKKK